MLREAQWHWVRIGFSSSAALDDSLLLVAAAAIVVALFAIRGRG
jgi:hypothetical protein